jgi:glycosyltransferase involved in cell wall biosynthesis
MGNITIHRIGCARPGASLPFLSGPFGAVIKALYVPWAYRKARALARKKKYDAYWCIMTNMGFPVVLLRMFARDKTAYVLTLQDGDTPEHIAGRLRIKLVYPLFKRIFTGADVVQTISEYLAKFARDMGYPGKPVVIPNGVDYGHFADPRWLHEGNRIMHSFGKGPNDVFLITTSRLVAKNAVEDIIRALRHLPERVRLLILGEGPLAETLWNVARAAGVAKRVRFVGHIGHDKLPAYLYASDIFVRPALSEGMGNSFVEAMAAGIPVIATPVGGIPDFLYDPSTPLGKVTPTGLFCKVRNPESIAQKVTQLLEDGALRNRIASNARTMVRERYDWDSITKQMVDLFSRL